MYASYRAMVARYGNSSNLKKRVYRECEHMTQLCPAYRSEKQNQGILLGGKMSITIIQKAGVNTRASPSMRTETTSSFSEQWYSVYSTDSSSSLVTSPATTVILILSPLLYFSHMAKGSEH